MKEATGAVVLDLAFEIAAFVLFVVSGIALAVAAGIGGGTVLVDGAIAFVGVLVVLLIVFFWMTANGAGFFFWVLSRDATAQRQAVATDVCVDGGDGETDDEVFSGKPLLLTGVVLLSVVLIAFKVLETFFIAWFFGVHLGLRDAFLLATLPGVVLLLPVPAGLGVYEGSNAATFALLGLPLNPVAFTMIIRLRDFIFIAIGVAHAVSRGEKLMGRKNNRMDTLARECFAVVAYFSYFGYPLTAFEVWKWLQRPSQPWSLSDVVTTLSTDEWLREHVHEHNGFYGFGDVAAHCRDRHTRYVDAVRKYAVLRPVVEYIGRLPGVTGVAVCNSLAYHHTTEKSDIDLFILTEPSRVWSVRLLAVSMMALLRKRPHEADRDPICCSFFCRQYRAQHCTVQNCRRRPVPCVLDGNTHSACRT